MEMNYDPENPLSGIDKSDPETIKTYFKEEHFHVPDSIYSENSLKYRRIAMRFIRELEYDRVRGHPVVPYLAITMFDNFTSTYTPLEKLLYEGEIFARIFITCCFLSAWRMRHPDFSPTQYMISENLNASEEQMEEFLTMIEDILIRERNCMPPVTALCFLDYWIGKLTELDQLQMRCLKSFATHKLCALKYDIRLAEFQPSVMAAAALASSINTFYEEKLASAITDFLHCKHLNKESLKRSVEMLIPGVTVCIPESPDNIRIPDISEELTTEVLLELGDITQEKYVPPSDCIYDADTDTAKPMPAPPDRIDLYKGPATDTPPHKKTAKTSGSGRKK